MDDRQGRKQSKTSRLFSILRRSSRSVSRTRPKTENTPPITTSPPPHSQDRPQHIMKGFFGLSISKPRKNVPTSRPESPMNPHDTQISRPLSPRRQRGSSLSSIEQRAQPPLLLPRGNETFPQDGSRTHPYHQTTSPPKHHPQKKLTIPTITHTPATPHRPGSSPPQSGRLIRSRSIDSTHGWYQPMAMDVVAEERLSKGEVVPGEDSQLHLPKLTKGKGKERAPEKVAPLSNGRRTPNGVPRTIKERRHGSFDFERSTRTSSIFTSNLAGIGTNRPRTENGVANKEPKPKPQSPAPTSRNSSVQNLASGAATIPDYISVYASSHSLERSQSTHQTQASAKTNGHAKKGQPSSWGPSTEKKSSADHSHETSKSGKRRTPNDLRLLGTTLGAFDFEPAVPSPNSHTTTRSDTSAEGIKKHNKESRQCSLGVPPMPSHKKDPVGFRSGTKGRSLDLGLGYAWASTKVREDALLPAFGRSLSISSKASSTKPSRRAMYVDEMGVLKAPDTDSKVGREVNSMFKQALARADYGEFRNFVHRFDANEIPVKGAHGILCEIERLLDKSTNLTKADKQRLLRSFAQIVVQHE